MSKLSFIYITNRDEPKLEWFVDSVGKQGGAIHKLIVVDGQYDKRPGKFGLGTRESAVVHVAPKPTVWSGPHRLTREDWWSISNSRNTGICLCESEWVTFIDDRSVMLPGWFSHIERAMAAPEPYLLAGAYQKRREMQVEKGVITHAGIVIGVDSRFEYCEEHYTPHSHLKPPYDAPGEWTYGCSLTLPLEWALEVGGFEEVCDGLSMEDGVFGLMIANNGHPIKYEPRMMMVEDRTPGKISPTSIRKDFGTSPNDFSHKVLNMLRPRKTAMHGFDIRQVRADALAGRGWPAPWGPRKHLWDDTPLKDL